MSWYFVEQIGDTIRDAGFATDKQINVLLSLLERADERDQLIAKTEALKPPVNSLPAMLLDQFKKEKWITSKQIERLRDYVNRRERTARRDKPPHATPLDRWRATGV